MAPGILFGSEERYEGFGLLFDSYDDDGKNDNPIIMGWINDGTKVSPAGQRLLQPTQSRVTSHIPRPNPPCA